MPAFRKPERRRNIQTIPFPIFFPFPAPPTTFEPAATDRHLPSSEPLLLQFPCPCVPPLGCPQGKGEKEKKEMGCCSPFLLLLRMQDISITGGKGGEIHSPSSSLFLGRRRQQHFGRFSEEEEKSRANMPRFPPFSSVMIPGNIFHHSFLAPPSIHTHTHTHTTEHSTNGFRKKRKIGIEREN